MVSPRLSPNRAWRRPPPRQQSNSQQNSDNSTSAGKRAAAEATCESSASGLHYLDAGDESRRSRTAGKSRPSLEEGS
jgi:hypothetical protein